jgi:hypothetical protein
VSFSRAISVSYRSTGGYRERKLQCRSPGISVFIRTLERMNAVSGVTFLLHRDVFRLFWLSSALVVPRTPNYAEGGWYSDINMPGLAGLCCADVPVHCCWREGACDFRNGASISAVTRDSWKSGHVGLDMAAAVRFGHAVYLFLFSRTTL